MAASPPKLTVVRYKGLIIIITQHETIDLTKPVTSYSVLKTQESKVVKNDKVVSPGMFRSNPFKNSRQCLITTNHDVCVFKYVNGMNSHDNNQSANVSNITNQKKHKANVKKTKKLGSKERLASSRPSKPRTCLRQSPNGRNFNLSGKIIDSSDFECKSDTSVFDNASAFNPSEPTSKRFPHSTSFLGRTKKIMETMNVTFNELSLMAFEQCSSKPELQGMTYGQISSGLDLTYASSTITSQKQTEHESELFFEVQYDDYIEAITDAGWIKAMQDELHQFKQLDVWISHRMLGHLQEYFCRNSILRRKVGELVLEKTRLYKNVKRRGKICVSIRLLCPSSLDEDTVNGL
nr:hypothetical protein [Tanacetum cinerariifolium]